MPFPLLGVAGAAISAGGTIGGIIGQSKANKQNLKIAREQMAFQERMRNTQYQAGVKDLQAAGLNPALAYEKGGADAPSGASAQMQNPVNAGATASTAQQVANIALTANQADKAGAEAKAVEETTRAQTALWRAQLSQTQMSTAKAIQDLRFADDTYWYRGQQERNKARSSGADADFAVESLENRLKMLGIDVKTAEVRKILLDLQKPEAQATARFYEKFGMGIPALGSAKDIGSLVMPLILKLLSK